MPWDTNLTPEQADAASHQGGHARLIAGPGTGKTLVMTRHVAHLVNEQRQPPTGILALTFTRHAAGELKLRVTGLVDVDLPPNVSTLHSFALRQLLRNGTTVAGELPQPLRIADDYEEKKIAIEDLKAMLSRNATETRTSLGLLSADWETLNADTADWETSYPDGPFLAAWQEHRRIYGYTLRSELVYRLKRALEQHPEFNLEGPLAHLLVDEYQDLNRCDLSVIRALVDRGAQLYAAGDDDQSIYAFRQAYPEGIRRFGADYTGAVTKRLTVCKRCDTGILNLASFVASQDYEREAKDLRPEDGRGSGEVRILRFTDQYEEAAGIASICRSLIDRHECQAHDILILLRQDRHGVYSSVLRDGLRAAGVAVSVPELMDPFGVKAGGEVRQGRQVLALLRIAANPEDHLAWRTLLDLRSNRIGSGAIAAVYARARQDGIGFVQALRAIAGDPAALSRFGNHLAAESNAISAMAETLASDVRLAWNPIDPTAIAAGVRATAHAVVEEEDERQLLMDRILEAAEESAPEDIKALLAALSATSSEEEQHIDRGKVNVLTMHKAKGLTADAVFVVGAEDELIPGRDEAAVALGDARRLLYVSLTRAKNFLFITYCQQRPDRQAFSGRNSGTPQRRLTRFLADGPLRVTPGRAYAEEFSR